MGHCMPKAPAASATDGPLVGTAVALAQRPDGGTPYPVVDYGYGRDPMAGMDHSAMPGMNMPVLGREGDTDGSGRVFGWATGAPYGARVLSMRDLVALAPKDAAPPTREIVVRLQGNMERYIWTLNGKKFGEGPPIDVKFGERVRVDESHTRGDGIDAECRPGFVEKTHGGNHGGDDRRILAQ